MRSIALLAWRLAAVATLVWCAARAAPPAPEGPPGALRASPTCDDIIGYSGPNDCAIQLAADGRIESVELLASGDTVEHADAVRDDPDFLRSFVGRSADELHELDGVSRATLTSLAVVEAVLKRISGRRTSLRFPEPITLAEVQRTWPKARALKADGSVQDASGTTIGTAIATGPKTEAITGYQGPTDVLLLFDSDSVLRGMALRRSYDNEKYVAYVREDTYFPESFVGKDRNALAKLEPVDGVSGATMTSQAIGAAIQTVAARMLAAKTQPREPPAWIRPRDVGTLLAVAAALLLTFRRQRGHRLLRVTTRVLVVAYLGILAGDMLSQGLLVGWVQNGLPSAAPGLIALAAVALLVPAVTKQQTYCHQLCAHGALQEMARRAPWRRPLPTALTKKLRHLPHLLLFLVALSCVTGTALPYHALEPFGAWAFPLAGIATCVLFVGSLLLATWQPMAYCRFGCPTGALLDFVRRRGSQDRFGARDIGAAVVLLVGVAWQLR